MLALATASFLAFGTLLVLFGANAIEITTALQLDYAEFGLLGSMLSLGLGLGIAIAGPISDRFSRRALYILACLLVVLATTTLGPDTSYNRLAIHLIAIGFGAGFYETVLNAVVVEGFAAGAGKRLLFIHSGAPLAACIAPLLIEVARKSATLDPVKWYDTFFMAGILHIPLIVAGCFIPMKHAGAEVGSNATTGQDRASNNRNNIFALVAIGAATFSYVGVESAFTIFVVDHVSTDLGLNTTRAAQTMSAFWGGLFFGRLAAGLSPRSPGAGTNAILAFFAAILIFAFGTGAIVGPEIVMGVIGLALGGVFPVMIGFAGQAWARSPATAIGIAGGFGSLGGFVIPWITGRLAATFGLSIALTSISGWVLLLAFAAILVRRRLV